MQRELLERSRGPCPRADRICDIVGRFERPQQARSLLGARQQFRLNG
jgi:hypothetical protein